MPGLVKIGYSTKDPELRAEELNHTGNPHKPIVEYDLLIEEPYLIERQVHSALHQENEGKEWFRCSVEDAVMAIQRVANGRGIVETYKHADRKKIMEQLELKREAQRKREELQIREGEQEAARKKEIEKERKSYLEEENKYYAKLAALNQRYRHLLSIAHEEKKKPLMLYWFGMTLLFALITFAFNGVKENLEGLLALILMFGLFLLYPLNIFRKYLERRRKSSAEYKKIAADRDLEEAQLTSAFDDWKVHNLKFYKPK